MSAEVKIPGVGNVKKGYAVAGVGVVVVILGYSYYRRSKANAAAPADTSATAADATPYSQTSDAAGYNTVTAGQQPYSPYGYDIYGNPIPSPTGAGSGGALTTNSDWAAAADEAIVATGPTLQVASLAVSRVLGGLSVTTTQQGYFLMAVGILGQPPQGYPKPIHIVDAPVPSTGSATPHAPSGLHAARVDRTGINLAWSSVSGAKGYTVYLDGKQLQTVTYTTEYVHDLKPHTTHSLSVAALGTNGKLSPKTTIHVTTHK